MCTNHCRADDFMAMTALSAAAAHNSVGSGPG
jgi:hypothetical protein